MLLHIDKKGSSRGASFSVQLVFVNQRRLGLLVVVAVPSEKV